MMEQVNYLDKIVFFENKCFQKSILYDSISTIEINKDDGIQSITYNNGNKFIGTISNENGPVHGSFNNYKSNILKSEKITYRGNFKDGYFDGEGRYENKCLNFLYEGSFQEGKFHGSGILKTKDFVYKGEFCDGYMEGDGSIDFLKNNPCLIKSMEGVFYESKIRKCQKIFLIGNREIIVSNSYQINLSKNLAYLNTSIKNKKECVICCDVKKKNIIYGPCMHPLEDDGKICCDCCFHALNSSAEKTNLNKCPICRSSINYIVIIDETD